MNACISGFGAVSSLGVGLAATRQGLYAEPRLPNLPTRVDTSLPLPVFEVPLPGESGQPGGFTNTMLGLALDEALEQAGLTRTALAGRKVGVCIGTTVACQLNNIPFYDDLRSGRPADAGLFRQYVVSAPAEWLRRDLRLTGPALNVSTACASGADAIGIGALWLEQGTCDLAIVGGADELNKVPLDGFHALGICSRQPCRPFAADRDGLNLGEGAAILILESSEHARRRGHAPRHALTGFGKASDAFHITQPHPDGIGLEIAIGNALRQAGATPAGIAFINAHGTGTDVNDRVEGQALARLFPPTLAYMSTKSLVGHTLGAAGALEAIFTCLMLETGIAVRNHRCTRCAEDIPVRPLQADLAFGGDLALSTSLAFGGSNTALAIRRIC